MGRYNIGRLLFCAFVITSAAPAVGAAQSRDCAALTALSNADGRKFADLRFDVSARAGLSVKVGREKADLPEFDSCTVDYGQSDIDVSCQWRFPDYAAALAFFDPLLEKFRRCLNSPLPQADVGTQGTAWMTLRRHEAHLSTGQGETDFALALVEYTRPAGEYLAAETAWYVELTSEWDVD